MKRLLIPTLLSALGFALTSTSASAQVFGTFSWQMQPYCNVVTMTITQIPGGFTINGNDNQCGAAKLAGAAGMALINPDGTVGLEFTIVTAPSGRAVHVSASLSPATGSGPWADSVGNSGTLALGSPGTGSPRPVPASGLGPAVVTATELAAGAVGSANIAAGAVGAANIAAGAVGAANINAAQVQARVTGTCPAGQAISGVSQNGTVTCGSAPVELLGAQVSGTGTLNFGSGATGALRLNTGTYEIQFNRNVTSCFYSANSYFSLNIQAVEPRSGNPNGVFLQSVGNTGTPTDGTFYLTVFCPRP